ncbi:phosphonate C-P lyase system protein PhnH [Cohnella faecalis]|uniref:Phosphonate C-P lyase system protein PhnH n=1 Tax=Cohnella faecalis TaxID=2315694 RepID=A0A398CVA3_9BACL|nr:phosphonate C-P lyase system protein PhnH [Cohnella faecalis]RIE05219.1 phosphonate C-P lyase system protein PhnH [Cohnella faecalis]
MIDRIHDIQSAYRKLVDSLSRPGLVSDLSPEAGKLPGNDDCLPATKILALMLLDTEVRFKVFSEREAEVAHGFAQLTYAKNTEASEADFLFVLNDAKPGELRRALSEASAGDLQNPNRSATIIVETRGISGEAGLRLTGPGIETEAFADVRTVDEWVELRAERNEEFPLGVDLIFVDADHRLLALPRTTRATREVI